MKRGLILLGGLLLLVPSLLYADNPDTAYITIKCTTTLSIDIRTEGDSDVAPDAVVYAFDYVAPGASTISASAVCLVKNDSVGAIERFKIYVSSAGSTTFSGDNPATVLLSNVAESIWTSDGINQFVVYGLFRKSQPADSAFASDDNLYRELTYGDNGGPLSGGSTTDDYEDTGYNGDQGKVLPVSYNPNSEKCGRKLWLKLTMPKAIEQNIENAYIKIKATAAWP
jgi:hypothetical protein